jgi:hypothetical protein
MPKKSQSKKSQSNGTPPVSLPQSNESVKGKKKKKEGDGLTFRLNDKALARKLRYVLTHLRKSSADYLEPLIRDRVDLDFAGAKADVDRLAGGGEAAEARKAE